MRTINPMDKVIPMPLVLCRIRVQEDRESITTSLDSYPFAPTSPWNHGVPSRSGSTLSSLWTKEYPPCTGVLHLNLLYPPRPHFYYHIGRLVSLGKLIHILLFTLNDKIMNPHLFNASVENIAALMNIYSSSVIWYDWLKLLNPCLIWIFTFQGQ